MAEETTEKKKDITSKKNWYGGTKTYKSRYGHRNAKHYYKEAVDKLNRLQTKLSAIYKDTNIANRQYELKKLEVEYGTKDFPKVIKELREQKDYTYKVLSSKYVSTPKQLGLNLKQFPHSGLNFHNDGNIPLSGETTWGDDNKIKLGNNLNPYYDEFYDHDSKAAEKIYKKAGKTKEEYIEQWTNEHGFPEDVLQFINPKNESAYVDPTDGTDLWGRPPSDPDFGIDPAVIEGRKKKNNETIEEKNGTSEFDAAYGVTGEGDGKGQSTTVVNNKIVNNQNIEAAAFDEDDSSSDSDTNRSELMSKRFQERAAEIENKPSRIQQDLMEDPRWSSERLAKLGIKDQDFQKAKGNKELMIQFKKDKAAGVYS